MVQEMNLKQQNILAMRVLETIAQEKSQRKKSVLGAQKLASPESYFRWSEKSKVVVQLDWELDYVKNRVICGNEISLTEFEQVQQQLFKEHQGKDWYDFHPILFAWRGGTVETNQNTFQKCVQELKSHNVALRGVLMPCNLFDMIALSLSSTTPNQILIGARDSSLLTENTTPHSSRFEWRIESDSSLLSLLPGGKLFFKPSIKKIYTGGEDMYVRAFYNYLYVCKLVPGH